MGVGFSEHFTARSNLFSVWLDVGTVTLLKAVHSTASLALSGIPATERQYAQLQWCVAEASTAVLPCIQ